MTNNAQKIAESCDKFKRSGDWFLVKCPCHDDKNPSLGMKDGDNGFVIFKCQAGCDSKEIASYFKDKGHNVSGKENQQQIQQHQQKKEIARYQYISLDGVLLFEKIRYHPKDFRVQNPHGWGDGGNKGALYNAQLMRDAKGKVVYIVEGEKDADTVTKLGCVAVTTGGSSAWHDKNNYLFDGAIVRILPDNDDAGRKYAKMVRESLELFGKCASIRVMFCPQQHKDVSDWLPTWKQLDDLFNVPMDHKFKTINFNDLIKLDVKSSWVVRDYVEQGSMVQVFGASGSGKSFFVLDMAYCVAAGIPFFGKKTKKGNVLYVAGEGFIGLKKRCVALQNKYSADIQGLEFSMQPAAIMDEESCLDVADRIKNNKGGFDLVIIDTLNRNMGNGDENSTKDMTLFLSNVDKFIRSCGCSVLIVHHTGLQNPERARGSSAMYAAIDGEFRVSKPDGTKDINIHCTKQKEGDSGWDVELELLPVVVGYDSETMEDIYSCVITESTLESKASNEKRNAVIEGLKTALISDGIDVGVMVMVADKYWKKYAYELLESTNKRRDFVKEKDRLIMDGYVKVENGLFYIP